MAQKNDNIDTVIEQIVCASLLGDKEYQKTEDKARRKFLYDQQKGIVNDAINQMCELIESKLPKDIDLPRGLRVEVANQMLDEVTQNPTTVISNFKFDEKAVIKNMSLPVHEEDKKEYSYQEVKETESWLTEEKKILLEEFRTGKEEIYSDMVNQAFSENGTYEDKQKAFSLIELDVMEIAVLYDLKFEDLQFSERGFIVATLRQIRENGDFAGLEALKTKLGITDEIINDEGYDGFTFEPEENQTKEEFETDMKIKKDAAMISAYIRHGDKNLEVSKAVYSNIERMISSAECPVDSLVEALQNEDCNNPRFRQIFDLLNEKLKDPNTPVKFEKYLITTSVSLVTQLMNTNSEQAEELINNLNIRLNAENEKVLLYDSVKKMSEPTSLKNSIFNSYLCEIQGMDFDTNEDLIDAINNGTLIDKAQEQRNNEQAKREEERFSDKQINEINNESKNSNSSTENDYVIPRFSDEIKYKEEEKKWMKKGMLDSMLEMKKRYGTEMALRFGYENISDQDASNARKKLWFEVIESQLDIENIKNGKSIVDKGEIELLSAHLKEICSNGEEKSALQNSYIVYLNENLQRLKNNREKSIFSPDRIELRDLVKQAQVQMDFSTRGAVKNTYVDLQTLKRKGELRHKGESEEIEKNIKANKDDGSR